MLKSHKQAMNDIKSAHQRVRKATEERDKLREKLKQAQARLALEKDRLKKSQEILET
jgi:outer membrane protein TolC